MSSHRKSSTRNQPRTRAVANPSPDTVLGVDLWAQKYRKRTGSTLTGPAQRSEIELFLQSARKKKQKEGKAKKSGTTRKAATAEPPVTEPITIDTDSAEESKKPPGTRKSTVEDASIQVDESEEAREPAIEPNASTSASGRTVVNAIGDTSLASLAEDQTTPTAAGKAHPPPASEGEHEVSAPKSKRKVC